jgi:hypothetical protein
MEIDMNTLGIAVTIEVIDQEQAKAYLDNNARHRPIKAKKVFQYMDEMVDGKWRLNGKTITFDRNGRLLNGQHRLTAVLQSGVPLTTLVVRGLDPELVPAKSDELPTA